MPPKKQPRWIVDIPQTDLWTLLFERTNKPFSDDQPIYTDALTNRRYTYADVKRTAKHFGAGLRTNFSWKKGDVVALFSPNCIDTPTVTFGTHWAGGIVSPANPAYTADELTIHLLGCGAKVLVTQAALLPLAIRAANNVGMDRRNIILIGDAHDKEFRSFTSILDDKSGGERAKLDCKKDLGFLVYSSGTTGHPKGVMLSHLNSVSDVIMLSHVEGAAMKSGKDKILAVLPYYHIYGLMCLVLLPLYTGLETVVMSAFDIKIWCETVQNHKVTYCYVAPPIVVHLAKNPLINNYDLSSLNFITSGAAPLTKDLIVEVHERLGVRVKQAYGLSETSPVTHMMFWDDNWKTAMGSCGPPLPNIVAKFMDADGNEVATGKEGEMWIAGPTVFQGYLNNDKATAECMTSDSFFKTGDIGFEDENGNLYITDRVKELIKYKGSQVAPAELEGILLGHPKVNDAAVIGWHMEEIHSEVPMAFVVIRDGEKKDEKEAKELISWLGQRTSKTKLLRGGIIFIDEIPKSASGKILRRILKELTKEVSFNGGLGRQKYQEHAKL